MEILPGTRLGPYEIVAPLGAGGMGVVYRARDTRLSRDVAIKVLHFAATAGARDRERMVREARAVSALSHPNICQLYDIGSSDGIDYLVMELLDGESLADRLGRGPLPIADALRIATEIALALDAAHRAGIVHRDVKPGNVMLTRNGARLLDFGVAKAMLEPADEDAPTMPAPMTAEGAIVGTLRYMAPEQLEGRRADARTDVFAFGLVVYEMLTGTPAFRGNSQTTLITSILTTDPPPIRNANPEVPVAVERIVRRCLQKNPDDRWQSAQSLAESLRWAGEGGEQAVDGRRPDGRRGWVMPLLLMIAIGSLAALAIVLMRGRKVDGPPRALRFSVSPPAGATFAQNPVHTELAISPDGSQLALVVHEGWKRRLFVRPVDALAARPIEGTDGAAGPFWSPDSKWIGFFAGGFMKKVPVDGGPVQTICRANGGLGSWNDQGQIIFFEWGPATSFSVRMVRDSGGSVSDVTNPKAAGFALWPSFLADGRRFIFWRFVDLEHSSLSVGSIDDASYERRVLTSASRGEVRGDDLFYVRDSVLVRQRFDTKRLTVEGDPIPVAASAFNLSLTGAANFSVSADGGTVAWQRMALPTQLVWRDWSGREQGRAGQAELYRHFDLSPDGRRVAADLFDPATQVTDVWLFDVDRGLKTRLTSCVRGCSTPVWLHSGNGLVVSSGDPVRLSNPPGLAIVTLTDGSIRRLPEIFGPKYATSITADDANIIYTINRGRRREIEMIPIGGGKPIPLGTGGAYDEADAVLSPDQRWLAFDSDESGRPEIYFRPFGRSGETVRVSTAGGTEPQWGADDKALFFIDPNGMLIQAGIDTGQRPRVRSENILFRISSAGLMEFEGLGLRHYAVTRDRVLVRELPGGEDADPVTVVVRK